MSPRLLFLLSARSRLTSERDRIDAQLAGARVRAGAAHRAGGTMGSVPTDSSPQPRSAPYAPRSAVRPSIDTIVIAS
jgi:hypothetical protein